MSTVRRLYFKNRYAPHTNGLLAAPMADASTVAERTRGDAHASFSDLAGNVAAFIPSWTDQWQASHLESLSVLQRARAAFSRICLTQSQERLKSE